MTLPRSHYVQDDEEGVFHCYNRCVRRAYLCGNDPVTGRDFSHRKQLFVSRLFFLQCIFSLDLLGYAVMSNHFHVILRTRPDIARRWSDSEVATRWLMLCPKRHHLTSAPSAPHEEDIQALLHCPERIATCRQRLASLSWFMAKLDEYIARIANKEDGVTGRFWESRFKCTKLLDQSALCSCMVYVDLNLIRAALADTPENSDFTSIQQRILALKANMAIPLPQSKADHQNPPAENADSDSMPTSLCPIASDSTPRGILSMSEAEYIDLVDQSGRLVISGKPGAIDANLAPILQRIGVNPDAWIDMVSRFGRIFHAAAGTASNLQTFAGRVGRKWITGVSAARSAFVSSPV